MIIKERSKMEKEDTKAFLPRFSQEGLTEVAMKMKDMKMCLSKGLRNARR